MRVVMISDTHEMHRKLGKLPDGDILIHAGDLTGNGKSWPMRDVTDWLRSQPHPHKVVIAGNHDISLQTKPHEMKSRYFFYLHYLNEESVTIEGLKVFGTPWSPAFMDWAFNAARGIECREKWAKIPDDTDILVVHGPPYKHGDRCEDGREVGCPDLLARIQEVKPRLVVCGHVHEGSGVYRLDCGTVIVNASVLDENYRLKNAPVVFDLA